MDNPPPTCKGKSETICCVNLFVCSAASCLAPLFYVENVKETDLIKDYFYEIGALVIIHNFNLTY